MLKRLAITAAALLLPACATPAIRVELEHVSHPTAGGTNEDALWQANALLHWQRRGWYADAGLGVNVFGKHGRGFYGPALTATARAGYEFGGGQ